MEIYKMLKFLRQLHVFVTFHIQIPFHLIVLNIIKLVVPVKAIERQDGIAFFGSLSYGVEETSAKLR